MANKTHQPLPCEVVKDLLPLYIDGLTNEETNRLITEHLKTCEKCKATYENMTQQDIDIVLTESKPSDEKKIRLMKRIKRKHRHTIVIVAIAMLAIFVSTYYFTSVKIYPYPVDKMEVVERYQLDDGRIYVKVEFDSSLVALGLISYSNELQSEQEGLLAENSKEFLLGYRLINWLTQTDKPESGYLHFAFEPDDGIDAVYLRGWNGKKQLLLWQESDKVPIATDEINKEVPLLGAGFANTY